MVLRLNECKTKLAHFKQKFALKFGLIRIGIFGSVARNENDENSDLDIVVELEKPSLSIMYNLRESLRTLFGCNVDVVRFRESLPPTLKSNIQNEAIYV